MEKLLVSVTMRRRVEADPNDLVRALVGARELKGRLWLLGVNGSRRALQGEQVAAFGENERFMRYAQNGLLYYEDLEKGCEHWAFAPGADPGTQLPVLLERYEVAFAKRSHAGVQQLEQQVKQAELGLGPTS